jgi:hypothetical protein
MAACFLYPAAQSPVREGCAILIAPAHIAETSRAFNHLAQALELLLFDGPHPSSMQILPLVSISAEHPLAAARGRSRSAANAA